MFHINNTVLKTVGNVYKTLCFFGKGFKIHILASILFNAYITYFIYMCQFGYLFF